MKNMKKFIIFVLILRLSPLLSCTGPVQEDLEKTNSQIFQSFYGLL